MPVDIIFSTPISIHRRFLAIYICLKYASEIVVFRPPKFAEYCNDVFTGSFGVTRP